MMGCVVPRQSCGAVGNRKARKAAHLCGGGDDGLARHGGGRRRGPLSPSIINLTCFPSATLWSYVTLCSKVKCKFRENKAFLQCSNVNQASFLLRYNSTPRRSGDSDRMKPSISAACCADRWHSTQALYREIDATYKQLLNRKSCKPDDNTEIFSPCCFAIHQAREILVCWVCQKKHP